ncbi:MAG: hypothetical protein IJ728_03470 [Selenomonadaceae bacterium]|nr:hypothetical protein [Selenomonadaceae bacterium]
MQKKFFQTIFLAIIISMMSFAICSAENFKFVDAEDDTGYYVDIDNIKIESQKFITTTIAVVKANLNRMYIYNVKINYKEQQYQITSSKILEYDSRKELESNDRQRPFRPYAPKSEMAELVKFILYGGDLTSS